MGKQGQRYRTEILKGFENWLKRVFGFKEAIEARRMKREEKKIGQIAEAVKIAVETLKKKKRPEAKTQLVKPRLPPLWSGQEFDRWRVEVEKWFDNNKSTDEEKYIDLIESLKKNENIK